MIPVLIFNFHLGSYCRRRQQYPPLTANFEILPGDGGQSLSVSSNCQLGANCKCTILISAILSKLFPEKNLQMASSPQPPALPGGTWNVLKLYIMVILLLLMMPRAIMLVGMMVTSSISMVTKVPKNAIYDLSSVSLYLYPLYLLLCIFVSFYFVSLYISTVVLYLFTLSTMSKGGNISNQILP